MMNVAAIVEGYGDVDAVPALIGKIGSSLGLQIISPKPIRAGEWPKLRREGELERFIELAASRDPNMILILVDLDDDCATEEKKKFDERVEALRQRLGKPIEVVFAVREYEGWFLAISDFFPDDVMKTFDSLANADQIRGAKEVCSRLMPNRYKETQHQVSLTKLIDASQLYARSRSFRRAVRAVTQLSYEEIEIKYATY